MTCTGTATLPASALATYRDLAGLHEQLLRDGVHRRSEGWVVARREDVEAALASPVMRVAHQPTSGAAPAGPARVLQARMARFSDPPEHARRRALAEGLLPPVRGLAAAAARRTTALVSGCAGPVDAMHIARSVPVHVLAVAMGLAEDAAGRVTGAVGRLCDALASSLDASPASGAGDEAALELTALLRALGPWDDDTLAAAAGLLFQARDATAAAIGAALLAGRTEELDGLERALRRDAPVQCTRRVPAEDVVLGGVLVPRGEPVWVVLGAAEQGPPAEPATFGHGQHSCPGAKHARALATGVLSGLEQAGWRPAPSQPNRHERRPNLRMPASVEMEQS